MIGVGDGDGEGDGEGEGERSPEGRQTVRPPVERLNYEVTKDRAVMRRAEPSAATVRPTLSRQNIHEGCEVNVRYALALSEGSQLCADKQRSRSDINAYFFFGAASFFCSSANRF